MPFSHSFNFQQVNIWLKRCLFERLCSKKGTAPCAAPSCTFGATSSSWWTKISPPRFWLTYFSLHHDICIGSIAGCFLLLLWKETNICILLQAANGFWVDMPWLWARSLQPSKWDRWEADMFSPVGPFIISSQQLSHEEKLDVSPWKNFFFIFWLRSLVWKNSVFLSPPKYWY